MSDFSTEISLIKAVIKILPEIVFIGIGIHEINSNRFINGMDIN